MNIRIKTTDYKITNEVSDYLDEKLAHLQKLLGTDADQSRCEVELGRAAGRPRHGDYLWFAEIQVKRPGSQTVVARNQEPTINAAIDNAKDEAMRQLRKTKTVRKSKTRKEATKVKRMLRG